jgi:hypothetical protein
MGARNHRALWILHYAGNRPRNDSLGNGERGAEDDYSESYKADKPGTELVSHVGSPDKTLLDLCFVPAHRRDRHWCGNCWKQLTFQSIVNITTLFFIDMRAKRQLTSTNRHRFAEVGYENW